MDFRYKANHGTILPARVLLEESSIQRLASIGDPLFRLRLRP